MSLLGTQVYANPVKPIWASFGSIGPPPAYLSAEAIAVDQTINPGAAVAVNHSVFTEAIGILPVGPAPFTTFQVNATGVYKLLYSIQYLGAGNGKLAVWLVVNGNNVPNTASYTAFKNNDEAVITCEFVVALNAGDTWGWKVQTMMAACDLEVIPATASIPLAPAVITTAVRIA